MSYRRQERMPRENGSIIEEPNAFVEVACGLCGSRNRIEVGRGYRFGIRTRVVLCRSCGLVYQNPRPSEAKLSVFYDQDYRRLYSGSNEIPPASLVEEQIERGREILKTVGNSLPPNSLVLDIGCGPGATLLPFREAGHRVLGLEPGPYGAWGAEKFGIDVRRTTLDAFDTGEDYFDLAILTFVLEHVPSPRSLLQQVHNVLAAQGLLYVEVPNLRKAKRPMANYFHVAHMSYFTANSLSSMLRVSRFDVISLDSDRPYALTCVTRPANERDPVTNLESAHASTQDLERFLKKYRRVSQLRGTLRLLMIRATSALIRVLSSILGPQKAQTLENRLKLAWTRLRHHGRAA